MCLSQHRAQSVDCPLPVCILFLPFFCVLLCFICSPALVYCVSLSFFYGQLVCFVPPPPYILPALAACVLVSVWFVLTRSSFVVSLFVACFVLLAFRGTHPVFAKPESNNTTYKSLVCNTLSDVM